MLALVFGRSAAVRASVALGLVVAASLVGSCARAAPSPASSSTFTAHTGSYTVKFSRKQGTIAVSPTSSRASLDIKELSGNKKSMNLLTSTNKIKHSGSTWTLSGKASWATFTLKLAMPVGTPGLLHWTLSVKPKKDAPSIVLYPDVTLTGAPSKELALWAPAPPVAGTSIAVSSPTLGSSALYLANLTSLGSYFDRTGSGGSQGNFSYPRAGTAGALVGVRGGSFGYVPPPTSLGDLPTRKATTVVDSYLYLIPGAPADEAGRATAYLNMLAAVYGNLRIPSLPAADWHTLAQKGASDLSEPANLVTVGGVQYLRSYVSDSRSSPELITQADVLAGLKAYEKRYGVALPLTKTLETNLPTFYNSTFHSVTNGLNAGAGSREESWYFINNMISLLHAAQDGSDTAKKLLLDSAQGAISLAQTNNYEFPQSFTFSTWNGQGTGFQPDVAGGYAYLMLGLHDMTGEARYLDEAKTSIRHVEGKGFGLTYETQMTAYAAAAAQRLFTMTHDAVYRNDAHLALANLFHVTRLWDCTYGLCRKGHGYHTIFGVNILPWGNYIAMLEQEGAWLGLRSYMSYADDESAPIRAMVQGFLDGTPSMMQYALPPNMPAGVVPPSPGLYDFVTKNVLTWNIPVEDLRTGETPSGTIGQEIYGSGGEFMFAAYAP